MTATKYTLGLPNIPSKTLVGNITDSAVPPTPIDSDDLFTITAPSLPRPIIAALGSSSVELSYTKELSLNDNSQICWNETGWVAWAARFAPQVDVRLSHTFGFSGYGSEVFLSNVGLVTGATPRASACLVAISSNDATFYPELSFNDWFTKVTNNYISIFNILKSAGIKPIAVVQHLRADFTVGSTSASRQSALFSWGRRLSRLQGGVEVVDLSSALSDKTSSNNVTPTAYLNSDNIHLSILGCCLAGMEIAKVLTRLFPTQPSTLIASPGDTWSLENPYGSIINNPGMLGTSGSGGSNIATGWTLSGSTGVTVTPSKITDTDTGWVRQRLVLSGTPTTDGFILLTGSFVTNARSSLSQGDQLVSFCDYKVSGNMTGFRQAGIRFTATDSGYGGDKTFRNGSVLTTGTGLNSTPHSATLRTPTYTVINTPTALQFVFSIDLVINQAVDFTVDLGPMGIVKI